MIDWSKWIAGWAMVAGSYTSATKVSESEAQTRDSRQLVLLGIVLQVLHILFGVTAIIGVLVTQTRTDSTRGTVYESQLRWQFVTFWMGLAGYAMGFYVWATYGNPWLVPLILLIIMYRLVVSAVYWRAEKPMKRMFF